MDQRGMSASVQMVLLFPLAIGLLLSTLQWAMVAWADATALAAVHEGLHVATEHDNTLDAGREAAREVAANGALTEVSVRATTVGNDVEMVVTGTANVVVLQVPITKSGIMPKEVAR